MPVLAEKEYCTGCTACASACPRGCIAMTADGNGFLCPVIDTENCVMCGACEASCPILKPLTTREAEPQAYAAYSRDEKMRLESSSGGVFSELAKGILKEDGVVFGAAYGEGFEVVHICVETEEELEKLRGAKYAQSNLGHTFGTIKRKLDAGQKVLFSGTPCQVGGLKGFLRKDYENLVTVDFVCHSIPSPAAWREYVKYRAHQDNGGEPPVSVNLRSKQTGWSHYQYSNQFTYADGHAHSDKSSESLYMKLFVGGYINRESCANCQFKGCRRISDLTIGDFWGIWDLVPEMDDNKGTSLVLVHSERGAVMLERLREKLEIKQVQPEDASRQNPAMLQSSQAHPRRSEALAAALRGDYEVLQGWFVMKQPTLPQKLRRALRRFGKRLGI